MLLFPYISPSPPLSYLWLIHVEGFFLINQFILIGGWLLYSIVVVFAIHWHESAMGEHVSPKTAEFYKPIILQ